MGIIVPTLNDSWQ